MLNWFGPTSWDSPMCRECPRVEPPVETPCGRCSKPIEESDRGLTMPGPLGPVVFHLHCHLKNIVPHYQWEAAHLTPDDTDGTVVNGAAGIPSGSASIVNGVWCCIACGVAFDLLQQKWIRLSDIPNMTKES